MPALLNSRSSRPNRASTSAKSAATDSGIADVADERDRLAARLGPGVLERLAPPAREHDREAGAGQRDARLRGRCRCRRR